MSSPASPKKDIATQVPSSDKEFFDKYIDKKEMVLIFMIILLVIGAVLFLNICGAASSGSDPSGLVGSSAGSSNDDDSGNLDPAVTGFLLFLALFMIIIGTIMVVKINTSHHLANKLIVNKDRCGAVMIYPAKGKTVDDSLYIPQVALWNANLVERGIEPNSLVVLPPEMEAEIESRYVSDSDSDDETPRRKK